MNVSLNFDAARQGGVSLNNRRALICQYLWGILWLVCQRGLSGQSAGFLQHNLLGSPQLPLLGYW